MVEKSSSLLQLCNLSFLIYGSTVSQVTENKPPEKYTEGPLAWSGLGLYPGLVFLGMICVSRHHKVIKMA